MLRNYSILKNDSTDLQSSPFLELEQNEETIQDT
jgi:hypothetical protein